MFKLARRCHRFLSDRTKKQYRHHIYPPFNEHIITNSGARLPEKPAGSLDWPPKQKQLVPVNKKIVALIVLPLSEKISKNVGVVSTRIFRTEATARRRAY